MIKEAHLFLTTECNLRCKYCFVENNCTKAETMPEEVSDRAMEYISNELPEGVTVEFFGGEPLLQFGLIKRIIEARPMLKYVMPTNCLLMDDEKYEFFRNHRDFVTVTLSLDGDVATHVANRGQFPDINMLKKMSSGLRTNIRMVVENPKNLYEDVKFLAGLGTQNINISAPLMYVPQSGYKEELKRQLALVLSDKPLSLRVSLPTLNVGTSSCRAATEEICIAPNGDIYPCDIFYLKGEFKIGDIYTGIDTQKEDEFSTFIIKYNAPDIPCKAHQCYLGGRWIND